MTSEISQFTHHLPTLYADFTGGDNTVGQKSSRYSLLQRRYPQSLAIPFRSVSTIRYRDPLFLRYADDHSSFSVPPSYSYESNAVC